MLTCRHIMIFRGCRYVVAEGNMKIMFFGAKTDIQRYRQVLVKEMVTSISCSTIIGYSNVEYFPLFSVDSSKLINNTSFLSIIHIRIYFDIRVYIHGKDILYKLLKSTKNLYMELIHLIHLKISSFPTWLFYLPYQILMGLDGF